MNASISQRRQRLESTRRDLLDRLARIRRDRNHIDAPLNADSTERAIERQNDDVLERLEDVALRELGQVEHALVHLAAGRGNRCECCGAVIARGRLLAVPHATQCFLCLRSIGIPSEHDRNSTAAGGGS